ncbi:hypothetical protein BASA50_007996 [Batrachochytrium salamandrivorans]|uniref:Histone RNA hairpin-binding protein RNA-binding domain-containing protein n=1 Tax=Batrachochytrium salamandrivorans TaxID=1357716 RepID=A0ABQ8F5E0_9FUNG|nr:hypothetical protein BASA50_007996 [Batrachochytrium salamandrivorans]
MDGSDTDTMDTHTECRPTAVLMSGLAHRQTSLQQQGDCPMVDAGPVLFLPKDKSSSNSRHPPMETQQLPEQPAYSYYDDGQSSAHEASRWSDVPPLPSQQQQQHSNSNNNSILTVLNLHYPMECAPLLPTPHMLQPQMIPLSHHNQSQPLSVSMLSISHHQWNPHSYRRFNRAAGQTRLSASCKSSRSYQQQQVAFDINLASQDHPHYDYSYPITSTIYDGYCAGEDWHEVQSAADSIDTGASTEINSTVESLLTQSSRASSLPNEPSSEERRLEQRQKQIDYGKNTIGYLRYLECIPKNKRRKGDPETPERHRKCSKRAWDAHVRSWRRRLHQYDPPGDSSFDGEVDVGQHAVLELGHFSETSVNLSEMGLYDGVKRMSECALSRTDLPTSSSAFDTIV